MANSIKTPLWTGSFIAICLAHFVMTMGFHACMPMFPLFLADRFHLAGIGVGIIVASYTASAIITRPPTGFCLDRFGRRGIYLSSYCLFALVYLLYPLAEAPYAVALVRFTHGAFWGVTMGAANTAAIDLLPAQRRGEGIGYFGLTMVLGMSVGPALGTYVTEWMGYNFLFRSTAVLTLGGFLFLLQIRFPTIPRRMQPFSLHSLLERSSIPISLSTLVFCIAFSVFMNYAAMFARTLPDASPGMYYLCMAFGTAVTRLISGRRFDQAGPGVIINYGYGLLIVGCIALAVAQGSILFTIGGFLVGLGNGITIPVFQAMINALVPPERRGAANATQMTAFDLGICIGLLSTSHVQSLVGWPMTFLILTGCIFTSACIFHFSAFPKYRKAISPKSGTASV